MPRLLTGIADIVSQATNWRRIFGLGCRRPTPGRTTTLPASHATVGLRRGSFRATRTQNGKHLRPRVPFYGFMGNVCQRQFVIALPQTETLRFRSGCRKERTLVRQTFHIPIWRTHRVGSSTIIRDIDAIRKAGLASLAFFYCDFREDQKKDLRGLLSSLLVQLCHQSDSYSDILFKLYSEHANGSRHPSDDVLAGCLKDLLKLPGHAPVYLIVDALDECPNTSSVPSPRDEVLNLIEELIKSEIPNLRICVTSRPETDIKDSLDSLVLHSVSLHDETGQKSDIEEYIKSVIKTNPKNKRWKAADKQLVIDVLIEKADGM